MVSSQGEKDGRGIGVGVFFEEGCQLRGFERVNIGIVGFLTAKWAKVYAKVAKG
jgi:hypothetical protein